ncbi:MAG: hypothetical protein B1H13_02950 [Desulfobacteraceae bacterium 4484_190.3]|nr:MAG: hypothetical protein B1H13_02950 [Desulfobacteraceae bacterium 4484_190.3]
MSIWGEVELLCRAISKEGGKEAESILTQAKAEAEKIIARTERQTEKEFREKIFTQRGKAYAKARLVVDAAELEAKKRIITFRKQVISEIFSALELRLRSFVDQPGYPDFLMTAIKEGIDSLPGKEFVIELKQEDLELVKERLEALGKELSLKIRFDVSDSLNGGCRVYRGDRHLLYDNSFQARLKRHEDEIQRRIWRKIFGTERSKS